MLIQPPADTGGGPSVRPGLLWSWRVVVSPADKALPSVAVP